MSMAERRTLQESYLDLRKVCQDQIQLIVEILLRELDLPQVKTPDPGNLIVTVDDGRSLALRLGQDDVDEVLHRRDHRDLLEIVQRHVGKDFRTAEERGGQSGSEGEEGRSGS